VVIAHRFGPVAVSVGKLLHQDAHGRKAGGENSGYALRLFANAVMRRANEDAHDTVRIRLYFMAKP
jgi:hypothetical protein